MISERIRIARKASLLTQRELGELCNIAEPTIRRYELGMLNPKMQTLQKIANALELPMAFFLGEQPFEDLDLLDNYKEVVFLALKKNELILGPDYVGELSDASYYRMVGSCIDKLCVGENGLLEIYFKNNRANQPIQADDDISSMFTLTSRHIDLINAFDKLNEQGKDVAIIRMQELTKIEDYTKQ